MARWCALAFGAWWAVACGSIPTELPDGAGLQVRIGAVTPDTILPGTWVLVTGEGFVDSNTGSLTVLIERGGGSPWLITPERQDEENLRFQVDPALFSALGSAGVFQGTLKVRVDMPGGLSQTAEVAISWTLQQQLQPRLDHLSAAVGNEVVYLGSELEALGTGFLLDGEGRTELRLSGTFTPEGSQEGLPVAGNLIVLDAANRQRLIGPLPASGFGIQPGVFAGDVTPVNVHEGAEELAGTGLTGIQVELGPTFLTRVEPASASRGQWADIYGRGFTSGSATVVIRIEGSFTDQHGAVTPLSGGDALQIVPEVISGDHMRYVLRVNPDGQGGVQGLGAKAGVLRGTATPEVYYGADSFVGLPLPGELVFTVLPQKQVVYISYLAGFTDALRLFGLRNVESQIRDRIKEVVDRDYAEFSVEFRSIRPTDYLEYAVIEVGGEDPNGRDLLGLDNTMGKDTGNIYFDDIVGGLNADSRENGTYAFGGVFVDSFLLFSPRNPKAMPIASARFDEIFGPFMADQGGHEVQAGEYPGGARSEQIAAAVHALGSMIGNTITHEIGHTLGLASGPPDQYHNAPPGPGQIMDAGADRPFEERAEIDGHGQPIWATEDRAYLLEYLPK
jgi:hypothetical protein